MVSNGVISDAQVQVLISADENLSDKNKKKEIYNKKAVTKPAQSEEIEFLQKDTAGKLDYLAFWNENKQQYSLFSSCSLQLFSILPIREIKY